MCVHVWVIWMCLLHVQVPLFALWKIHYVSSSSTYALLSFFETRCCTESESQLLRNWPCFDMEIWTQFISQQGCYSHSQPSILPVIFERSVFLSLVSGRHNIIFMVYIFLGCEQWDYTLYHTTLKLIILSKIQLFLPYIIIPLIATTREYLKFYKS